MRCRPVSSGQVCAALDSLVASGMPLSNRYVVKEQVKRSTGSHGVVVHAAIMNLNVRSPVPLHTSPYGSSIVLCTESMVI